MLAFLGNVLGMRSKQRRVTEPEEEDNHSLDALIECGFTFFEFLRESYGTKKGLSLVISPDDLEIVRLVKSDSSLLTEKQILRLFELGDKFLATEKLKNTISEIYFEFSIGNEISNQDKFRTTEFWTYYQKFFGSLNFPIEQSGFAIGFDSVPVRDNLLRVVRLFNERFSSNCTEFFVKEIPLGLNDAQFIQSLFKPHFTTVRFEKCPFNFANFNFDFSKINLTQLILTGCYIDIELVSLLKTVSSNLILLDISENYVTPSIVKDIFAEIKRFTQLETLNLSRLNICYKDSGDLFNLLLNLSSLKNIDLSDNPIGPTFVKCLDDCKIPLMWESLNLSKTLLDDHSLLLISLILVKLKKLKYLNIKDNRDSSCVYFILRSIPDDSSLREIVYDEFNNYKLQFDVFEYFHERNLNIFPNFIFSNKPQFPSKISHYPYFKSLNSSVFDDSFLKNSSQIFSFDYIEEFIWSDTFKGNAGRFKNLFQLFKRIKTLTLPYLNSRNSNLALILLENNPIEHLELCDVSCLNSHRLANAIKSCNLKSLSLGVHLNRTDDKLPSFLDNFCKAPFWKNLTALSIRNTRMNALYLILKSIGDCLTVKSLDLDVIVEIADFELLPRFFNVKSLKLSCCRHQNTMSNMDWCYAGFFESTNDERNYSNFTKDLFASREEDIEKTCDRIQALLSLFPNLSELKLQLPEATYKMINLSLYKNTLLKLKIEFVEFEVVLESTGKFQLSGELPFLKELVVIDHDAICFGTEDEVLEFPNLAILNFPDLPEYFVIEAPYLRELQLESSRRRIDHLFKVPRSPLIKTINLYCHLGNHFQDFLKGGFFEYNKSITRLTGCFDYCTMGNQKRIFTVRRKPPNPNLILLCLKGWNEKLHFDTDMVRSKFPNAQSFHWRPID